MLWGGEFIPGESLTTTVGIVVCFWTIVTTLSLFSRMFLFSLSGNKKSQPTGSDRSSSTPCSLSVFDSSLRLWSPNLNFEIRGLCDHIQLSEPLLLALLDTVATFEVCACGMECWVFRPAGGLFAYMIALALNAVRGCLFTCFDAYGSPCNPWYRFLAGKTEFIWVGITWALQMIGAAAALQFAQFWWSFRWTKFHALRDDLAKSVSATRFSPDPEVRRKVPPDLNVSPTVGFFVEAAGALTEYFLVSLSTCALQIWNGRDCYPSSATACADSATGGALIGYDNDERNTLNLSPTKMRIQLWVSYLIRLLLTLTLTSQCLALTGAYINPANASVQAWGVGGVPPLTHLLVYWIGPLFGVWASFSLERLFVGALQRRAPMRRRSFAVQTQAIGETVELLLSPARSQMLRHKSPSLARSSKRTHSNSSPNLSDCTKSSRRGQCAFLMDDLNRSHFTHESTRKNSCHSPTREQSPSKL